VNLIVQVYESPQSLRVSAHLGETGSYHGTAAGKVFLAFGNIQTKSQIFASPLEKHTPKTIADKNQLEAEIDQVRQDGFATSQEELEIGFCALSAPVIDPAGNMLGAVTVAIPVSRFNEKNVQHCRSLLFQATHKIMEEFGTDFSLRS
jgi:DNA-binding IclR family transcriptional regulator